MLLCQALFLYQLYFRRFSTEFFTAFFKLLRRFSTSYQGKAQDCQHYQQSFQQFRMKTSSTVGINVNNHVEKVENQKVNLLRNDSSLPTFFDIGAVGQKTVAAILRSLPLTLRR